MSGAGGSGLGRQSRFGPKTATPRPGRREEIGPAAGGVPPLGDDDAHGLNTWSRAQHPALEIGQRAMSRERSLPHRSGRSGANLR